MRRYTIVLAFTIAILASSLALSLVDDSGPVPDAEEPLAASYSSSYYTITFYSYETGQYLTKVCYPGSYIILPDMERSGYKLDHWGNPNGALVYSYGQLPYNAGEPGSAFYPNCSGTLYAYWTEEPLTQILSNPFLVFLLVFTGFSILFGIIGWIMDWHIYRKG